MLRDDQIILAEIFLERHNVNKLKLTNPCSIVYYLAGPLPFEHLGQSLHLELGGLFGTVLLNWSQS
jgi:hypothetical protein